MKEIKRSISTAIILFLFIIIYSPFVKANGQESFSFGIEPDKTWIEKYLGKDFSFEVVRCVEMQDKQAVLYYNKKLDKAYFSIFDNKKEYVLWEHERGGAILSNLTINPLLLTGNLNGNEIPDLILCYSVDEGIGRTSQLWYRELLFFPDMKKSDITEKMKIPLSYADWICGSAGDINVRCSSAKEIGGPAIQQDTVVILFPKVREDEQLSIYILSGITPYDMRKLVNEVQTYQLTQYIITNSKYYTKNIPQEKVHSVLSEILIKKGDKGIIFK